MNCDVKAYAGTKPFIFISYAHDDAHMVYPIVERLVMDGYRVWYDDGIHAGEDWTEVVANRLTDSTICMAMLSENSVQSVNCRNEIAYSLSEGKTLIGVKLTDFEMPKGMKLQLGNTLYLERYRYGETEFYERFQISHGVAQCREDTPRISDEQLMAWRNKWANATPIKKAKGEPEKVKLTTPSTTSKTAGGSKKAPVIAIAGIAAVLILLAVILLPQLSKSSAVKEPVVTEDAQPETTEAQPEPTEEIIPTVTTAPVIQDRKNMDVIAYESTEGFGIQDIQCGVLGRGQTAQLEITIDWEDNTQIGTLYCFSNQSQPFAAGNIATFQKDFYKMSNLPLMSDGTIEQTQTTYYGNVPASGPIYLLLFGFDIDGNIVAYVTLEVDYPQESEA
ncbi:MAG: toll/interleukin-1 receptor domain-containing protein [Oscillospiraceae bacterium]|nr:toll/interleukin-1 receptor domain-containing protein [Oscillospiraceae bacterium]